MSGLIWVQTVCKKYQLKTLGDKELMGVEIHGAQKKSFWRKSTLKLSLNLAIGGIATLKRTKSSKISAHGKCVKTEEKGNIHNFTLKIFVYLDPYMVHSVFYMMPLVTGT